MNEPREVAERTHARWAALLLAGAGVALAGCGGGGGSGGMQAATPLFFVEAGPGLPMVALITDTTPGAQIYYTTNGATPTTASTLYTGPITVLSTETIEAIAAASGYANSAVGRATYVLLQASAPVFSVAPGLYTSAQTVAITTSTPGAQIYYTTDGSTPTAASTLYGGPLTVTSSETLKAIAVEPGYTASTVATAGYVITPPTPGGVLTGLVVDGQRAVVGGHVYLLAAGTTGYGQVSVTVLNAAQTGASDALGAYVTTDANGGFSMSGDYICVNGQQQVYLLALGGDAGWGANPAAGLMAAIGTCPSTAGPAVFATVNEVTTIAAAYAMAGFATDATHVSSSGTPLAQIGVANAFANAGNLATLATGVAAAVTPAGNATVPQAEIDTLANVLAACVGSAGATCSSLLSNALSGGTSGTAPTDTATAAIHIAHNPGANVGALYALAAGTPLFAPALSAAPTSFSIWLSYTGVADSPRSVAIDGVGNVWIANEGGNNVVKLSGRGVLLSGTNGYTGGGMSQPFGIAIDGGGGAWISNAGNGVTKLTSAGGVIYAGILFPLNIALSGPTRLAIDGAGNVWIPNYGSNSVSEVSNSDSLLNTFTGGGISEPEAVAIDGAGNAWVANGVGGSVSKISAAGVSQYAGGGLGAAVGIAMDGSGDAWVSNETGNGVVELSNAGTFLSGAAGYAGSGSGGLSIAVDGAGNVWSGSISGLTELSNAGAVLLQIPGLGRNGTAIDGSGNVWLVGAGVTEVIGAATPVVTPIAAGLAATPSANGSSKVGTRP